MMRRGRNERGMVLLLVLVVVALLTSLLVEFSFSTLVDLRLTETFRDSTGAYYLAKGGIRAGEEILRLDRQEDARKSGGGFDARTELWAQEGLLTYTLEQGTVSLRIEDLGGRLDLNRLLTAQLNRNPPQHERLSRLLTVLDQANAAELTENLLRWLEEQGQTAGRLVQLTALEELTLVPGYTPELVRLLTPHVTLWGDADININTASSEVLQALAEEIDSDLAERIIERRETTPFEQVQQINEISGLETMHRANMAVRSGIFHFRSTGEVNDGTRLVEAVVRKEGGILWWKVN
jgi:general secretion pathway protein K